MIQVETTVVPTILQPGSTGRIHVVLRPDLSKKAHWNNEVDDLVFWINPPADWQVDNQYFTVKRPLEVVSREARKIEFELKCPDNFTGTVNVPAYALYYVCEDINGVCLYLRQDLPIRIDVREVP